MAHRSVIPSIYLGGLLMQQNSAGPFNPGQVAGCSPFSMTSSVDQGKHISTRAFWRLPSAEIVGAEWDRDANSWQPAATVIKDMAPGTQFSVAHWTVDGAVNMRVYYQDADSSIVELCSEDGKTWLDEKIIVGAQPIGQAPHGSEGASVARATRSCVIA